MYVIQNKGKQRRAEEQITGALPDSRLSRNFNANPESGCVS